MCNPPLVTSDGVEIVHDMEVWTSDGVWGAIDLTAPVPAGWFLVVYPNTGERVVLNGDRVSTTSTEVDGRTPYEFNVDRTENASAKAYADEHGYEQRAGGYIYRKNDHAGRRVIAHGWDDFAQRIAGKE